MNAYKDNVLRALSTMSPTQLSTETVDKAPPFFSRYLCNGLVQLQDCVCICRGRLS